MTSDATTGAAPRVAFFGHDCTELTLIKRARAFRAAGLEVRGFTFRRDKLNRAYVPEWDDLDLGTTVDRHYGRRLLKLIRALPRILRARRRLRACDLIYARNIDMAGLALAGRWLAGSRAPLVYEVLDVQRVFTSSGPAGALFRFLERRVLARTDLLVVSSEAFVRRYFEPVQGFRGAWFLLENKIFGLDTASIAARPKPGRPGAPPCPPGAPWVIAWLGNLRCPRSPHLLRGLAQALGDRVQVHIHGFPTETGLERFMELIGAQANLIYKGEYRSPEDLPPIYRDAHFAWAFDYLDAGSNSDWLLPNRLYEAGFFGVPALAAAGTETGRRVEQLGLGWTVGEPVEETVPALLRGLTPEAYLERRRRLLRLPRSTFLDEGDTARLVGIVLGTDTDLANPLLAPGLLRPASGWPESDAARRPIVTDDARRPAPAASARRTPAAILEPD
ncbi:MAG TPA: glycosyltransferase [Geminicoccaceae bacterium]